MGCSIERSRSAARNDSSVLRGTDTLGSASVRVYASVVNGHGILGSG